MVAIIASEPELRGGRASESGHWYAEDGSPVYEIRGANGKMRAVTLRDAKALRKKTGKECLRLVPGVSSIVAMEYKPALERWKIEQALLAALTLPRLPNEDEGAFLNRAREDSQAQAKKAADRGTAIHAAIQGSFEGQMTAAEFIPFVESVRGYLWQRFGGIGEWEPERSFAHPLGYGGKSDIICRVLPAVVDFKCKDFGPEKTANELAWEEHCMQLAAYAHGFQIPQATCINVFVSTRQPGLIRAREWDASEIAEGWEAFRLLLRLWQIRRQYNSAFTREAA